MNMKYEGPLTAAFESDVEGVIKQEFITYRVKDGLLRKETTTRVFNKDYTDWNDTSSVEPIVKVEGDYV
jgi:hypothetical protein